MGDVNEKTVQYHSMPVHNPLYKIGPVCFRGNIVKAETAVERPEVLSHIVPAPLLYKGNTLFIVLLEVTELKEGFSEEDRVWNEIAIQIPVFHNGEPGLFVCENYCSDISGILSGRETYGYPKVPARISLDKSNNGVSAKLMKYASNKEILHFTCRTANVIPSPAGPHPGGMDKKMPKIILLKYIPSATMSDTPDVHQLVTMKYRKPVIHKIMTAEGNIEIREGAPDYLQEARITKTLGLSCLDMETNVMGGEILHNYQS